MALMLPCADRLCQLCDAGVLDDQAHVVFECMAFEDLRRTRSQLFGPEVAFEVRQFFACSYVHCNSCFSQCFSHTCKHTYSIHAYIMEGSDFVVHKIKDLT